MKREKLNSNGHHRSKPQPHHQPSLDLDVVSSLDVLDRVIGEFDDGCLSESDRQSVRSSQKLSYNEKIDRIFDTAEQSKIEERINNFQIISGDRGEVQQSDIPAPGTVLAAKRQYLDNLQKGRREVADQDHEILKRETCGSAGVSSRRCHKTVNHVNNNGSEAVNKVERAVISELKQQVQGKEGKFIKVGGSRCSNNKHEAGKKHRSSEKSCIHQTARSSPTKLTKSPVESSSSSVTGSSKTRVSTGNGKPRGHVSRSRSADPHHSEQERRPWSNGGESSDNDSWSSTSYRRHHVRSPREAFRHEARGRGERHGGHGQGGHERHSEHGHERHGHGHEGRTPRSRSRDTMAASQKMFSHHPSDNVWPASRSGRGLDKGQRQKSMIDLSSAGGHRSPQDRGHGGHRQSMMDLRSGGWRETDNNPGNKRYSMAAVGDHIPPHLRHFMTESGANGYPHNIPAHLDEQLRYQHQMNIEAQRDLLRQRGFSSQHPLVRGEIAIHPELVGHLHFGRPGQTSLPLHHDDFLRFLPEMQRRGMQTSFPDNKRQRPRDKQRRSKSKNEERSRSQDPVSRHNRECWDRLNMVNDRVSHHQPFIKHSNDAAGHPSDLPWYMRPEHQQHHDHGGPSLVMQSRTDSGIGEEIGHRTSASPRQQQQHLPSCNKSSFGMILKDKFQKNPNMYFPAPSSLSPSSPAVIINSKDEDEDWSDADTLVHNMSEGSFDKDSGLSAGGGSSGSGSHDHHDLESVLSGVRSQSITTPIKPVQTSIILESNPSVILNKKTLRNYTPRESSCLLRQFEEERLYSGRDHKRLGLDLEDQLASPQFSSLTSRKSRVGGQATRDIDMDTCTSHVSQWSAASFDWHAGSVKRQDNDGWERPEPEGEPSHDNTKHEQKQSKIEQSDLGNDDDDGLGNLRKLLKEGKIVGLNDKPPAFIPPSPPSCKSANGKMKPKAAASKGQASAGKGPAAPSKLSEHKNRKHDKRLAPPPPTDTNDHQFKTPTPSSTVQFLGGRRVQSVENICADLNGRVDRDPRHHVGGGGGADLKRSTSIHAHNAKEYLGKSSSQPKDSSLAQLIADSTEKKFRFNSLFKGIWKKKQNYSLDDC